ncbi:MAG TPA: hypothetical protein VIX81_03185 [Gammaproteobacteria bacterium]
MSKAKTCSSCKQPSKEFNIRGTKRGTDGQDVDYQLCRGCCIALSTFNPKVQHRQRQDFWDTVWSNIGA